MQQKSRQCHSAFYSKENISALQQFIILLLVIEVLIRLKHFKGISHLHFSNCSVHTASTQTLKRHAVHSCFKKSRESRQISVKRLTHTRGYVTRTIYSSRLCLEATDLSRLNSCIDKERPAFTNLKLKPKCLGGLGFVIGRVWDFLDRLMPSKYFAFYSAYT